MQKSIERLVRAQNKIFKVFNSMIKRLERQSLKLQRLEEKAKEELEYYNQAQKSALVQIDINNAQINKIKKFME